MRQYDIIACRGENRCFRRNVLGKGWLIISPDQTALTLYPFPAELINQRMREVLACDNPEIDQIIAYLLEGSGKMLRPRLVFLSASMNPHDTLLISDIAVAVELVHMASLIHDDVIDQSDLRRGRESLNSRWGNQASVLTGDYLFAAAYSLINQHKQQQIIDLLSQTIQIMCAGEIKQMSLAHKLDISQEEYLEKSHGKTACLFAFCCKVGALASAMPEEGVKALENFGLCLGYAYQIIDDLLDFLSDSSVLGKPCGSDLLEGNITLPLIYVLQDQHYGPWLKALLSQGRPDAVQMNEIIESMINSRAVDNCLDLSRRFLARGIAGLNILPNSPALKAMIEMAHYLLQDYYHTLNRFRLSAEKELGS